MTDVNKGVYSQSILMYFTNDPSFQFSCIYFVFAVHENVII